MALWIQYLIVFAALVLLAPPLAWAARRLGSRAKGGLMLASVLLGFGAVLDQPAKHAIEATERAEEGEAESEPKEP
jgi:hypothetical protein